MDFFIHQNKIKKLPKWKKLCKISLLVQLYYRVFSDVCTTLAVLDCVAVYPINSFSFVIEVMKFNC